jgi:sec-independent protein translocase protein TatC
VASNPDLKDAPQKEMSFGDHLLELRSRLLKSVIAVMVCTIGCYFFWEKILALFTGYPLHMIEKPPSLIYTAPAEAFMISFKIAIFGGIFAAAPIVLYQVWCFISPGLYLKEKRTIFPVVFFSTLFFASGVVFCYMLVLPMAFRFLLSFYTVKLLPMLSINTYIGFVIKMLAAFGLVFELPVFAFILARLGLITHRFLIKQVRYAIVLIFIVAAILTPPDVLSQTLMAVPMLFLYGLSIIVAYFAGRKDAR